jgi:hypothetical protein
MTDDPKANSPEDVGYVHPRARPKPAPKPSDAEVLRAFKGYEGTREAEPGVWFATLRKKNGKAVGFCAPTEAEAMNWARVWVEAQKREEG